MRAPGIACAENIPLGVQWVLFWACGALVEEVTYESAMSRLRTP